MATTAGEWMRRAARDLARAEEAESRGHFAVGRANREIAVSEYECALDVALRELAPREFFCDECGAVYACGCMQEVS